MSLADLMRKGALRGIATATPATAATDSPQSLETVATVAEVAVAEPPGRKAANDPALADPDRWCWPHSSAMNGAEIDRFTARVTRFAGKGLTLTAAEALADKLVIRDRGGDDRRLCLECANLRGQRCGVRTVADIPGGRPIDALPILQRCDRFEWPATRDPPF